MKIVILFSLLFGLSVNVYSQDYMSEFTKYPFINIAENNFQFIKNAYGYNKFLYKWKNLIERGDTKLEILHIGDSHIQADFLTEQLRTRFQTLLPGLEGARGFVFPYNLAKTNNPTSYLVSSSNKWNAVWSTKQRQDSILGLAGIKIYSEDSVFDFSIKQKDSCYYSGFDSVEILFNVNDTLTIKSDLLNKHYYLFPNKHICKLKLSNISKCLNLKLVANSKLVTLEIFGFVLYNNYPGVIYNSIGLNGAKAESINRCKLFENELQLFNPDLIILSLGTNDLYSTRDVLDSFKMNYAKLLRKIRSVFPHRPIILTAPGDFRVKRFYTNKQLNILPQVIAEFAQRYKTVFWNYYLVMGGKGSMDYWWQNRLSANDKVHLNKDGYKLKGDLFFSVMLKSMESYNELKFSLKNEKSD